MRRGRHFTGRSVYHPVTAVARAGVSARRPLPPSYLPPPVRSEEVFIGRAASAAAASFFPDHPFVRRALDDSAAAAECRTFSLRASALPRI